MVKSILSFLKNSYQAILFLLIVTAGAYFSGSATTGSNSNINNSASTNSNVNDSSITWAGQDVSYKTNMSYVHFIDVGFGDATLINGKTLDYMLIDCGSNESSDMLISYLEDEGVEIIDVLVGTCLDEYHIGGMDEIIEKFEINTIYLPDIDETNELYEDVIAAANDKGYVINKLSCNDNIQFDDQPKYGTVYSIMDPPDENVIEKCLVINFYLGGVTSNFLYMSNADTSIEKKVIERFDFLYPDLNLDLDLIKIGNYGSNNATSIDLLEKYSPSCAIISIGDNPYGYPSTETIETLEEFGVNTYRTDDFGTIIIGTTGNGISNIEVENNESNLIIGDLYKRYEDYREELRN